MPLDQLAQFFGWCSILNLAVMIVTTIVLVLFKGPVSRIHGRLFGIEESGLARAYFSYLACYKIAIFVFNIVPYFALTIMG